jgi:hypothetical protein
MVVVLVLRRLKAGGLQVLGQPELDSEIPSQKKRKKKKWKEARVMSTPCGGECEGGRDQGCGHRGCPGTLALRWAVWRVCTKRNGLTRLEEANVAVLSWEAAGDPWGLLQWCYGRWLVAGRQECIEVFRE